jgi:ABC-type Mn2+/Zn2+ transport system permease subunit
VAPQQLAVLVLTSALVLCVHGLFYKEFLFTSFDPETARAAGMNTLLFNQLLFLTLAVATSTSIRSIGALPVFAFMVLPAATALMLTERLPRVFLLAVGIGLASAVAGFYLSFLFSLPTGPAMIAISGLFLLAGPLQGWWGRR